MGVDRQLPPKREVALALLQASMVSVYLDPRAEDVHVPPWFKKQPQLMLQIGLNMPVPIPDLDVGDDALSCTLSFNRRPEFCRIPWRAVYALVGQDGRGMIWPDDVPAEVAAQTQGRPSAPKERSHLRAVPTEPTEEAAPTRGAGSKKARSSASSSAEKRKKKAASRSAEKAEKKPRPAATQSKVKEPVKQEASVAPGSQGGARKGKLELPSYLRIVK